MKVYTIVELHDLTKKLRNGERLKNYEYVQAAQSASEAIILKIKSFLIANSGESILTMPTKLIFRVSPVAMEELEMIKKGYEASLKTPISIGIAQELPDAEKALARSVKTQEMEFWHPGEDKEESEDATDGMKDPNRVPDKKKIKETEEPKPLTIEEELQAVEGYKQALLQMIMAPIQQAQAEQQAQMEAQQQAQAGQDPQQQQQEGQPQEEQGDPEAGFQEQMFQPQEVQPEQAQEPLQQSDDKTEMDPAKAEVEKEEEPKESTRDRIEGLLATIKMFMPEMLKIVEKNPENAKVVTNMISSVIKLAKSVQIHGEDLSKNFKKKRVSLAVGTIKDGKIKVKDPTTNHVFWRGIRTGLMQGPDGAPLSTKLHNQISADNELGKEELDSNYKYTFAKKPDGAYYVFAHDHKGNKVAHLKAEDYDDDIMVHNVKVEEHHRRKGVATSMYKLLESKTGRKAVQDKESSSNEGDKLWSQPNRPFGVKDD